MESMKLSIAKCFGDSGRFEFDWYSIHRFVRVSHQSGSIKMFPFGSGSHSESGKLLELFNRSEIRSQKSWRKSNNRVERIKIWLPNRKSNWKSNRKNENWKKYQNRKSIRATYSDLSCWSAFKAFKASEVSQYHCRSTVADSGLFKLNLRRNSTSNLRRLKVVEVWSSWG